MSWGLAGDEVEEIDLAPEAADRSLLRSRRRPETLLHRPRPTDARNEKWRLEYDSGHVLAFVADAIRVAPRRRRSPISASTPRSRGCFTSSSAISNARPPLTVVVPGSEAPDALAAAEVVIVDLGIDANLFAETLAEASGARATACVWVSSEPSTPC